MCEGLSTIINGPIPTHPMFLKEPSFESISARSNNSLCEGPSKISGPIVSHFGYENENEKSRNIVLDYSKNPRVKGAGKSNFDAYKNGNGAGLLIELQGRSIVPQTYKLREPPKNHIAANTIKIKQLMRKVKEREAQKERIANDRATPVKALWKSDKYKDVQSKLKELLIQQPMTPRTARPEQKNFLKAHSRTGSITRPQTAREAPRENDTLLNLGTSDKKFQSKDDIDFIKRNQQIAKQATLKRAPSVEQLKKVQEKLNTDLEIYEKKIKGKVPKYLEERKEQARKEQEEYIKNLPDPDQPPGHRKLPDDERQKTLSLLQESHKNLLSELNSLPIRNDTLKLKTTKSDMEKRLVELDEAIKIFSKPKVFIKVE